MYVYVYPHAIFISVEETATYTNTPSPPIPHLTLYPPLQKKKPSSPSGLN